jgi:hypothetical protein
MIMGGARVAGFWWKEGMTIQFLPQARSARPSQDDQVVAGYKPAPQIR